MDDKPKAQVSPPLSYADYGVDWARPGADRTVWMTATEILERHANLREARRARLAEQVAELEAKFPELKRWADGMMFEPDPAPTESEAALHRAVLATRRDGE